MVSFFPSQAVVVEPDLVSIQVNGVQRIATRKVWVLELVPIVFVYRPCARERVEKRADVQLVVQIWGQGLGGDLLSLPKQGKKGQLDHGV